MNEQDIWQMLDAVKLFEVWRIVLLLGGIGFLVFVAGALNRFAAGASERFPSHRLLFLQIVTTVNFCVYIFGGAVLIYAALSPARELLIALGGGAAVAIGLSLKDLVASLVAGWTLLFDRPFLVGDRVQFGEVYGEIKSIGLRSVKLVTLEDSLGIIPNAPFRQRRRGDHAGHGRHTRAQFRVRQRQGHQLDADRRLPAHPYPLRRRLWLGQGTGAQGRAGGGRTHPVHPETPQGARAPGMAGQLRRQQPGFRARRLGAAGRREKAAVGQGRLLLGA